MNIHVGNVSPETSVSVLRGWFEAFGRVTDVSISTYRVNDQSRSVGCIEMPSHNQGQAAIAGLRGKERDGAFLTTREE